MPRLRQAAALAVELYLLSVSAACGSMSGPISSDVLSWVQSFKIRLEVDFGREPAARPAESLIVLPPFAPAADKFARTTVSSAPAVQFDCLRQSLEKGFEHARTAEAQESFPDTVPMAELRRQARQVMLWTIK